MDPVLGGWRPTNIMNCLLVNQAGFAAAAATRVTPPYSRLRVCAYRRATDYSIETFIRIIATKSIRRGHANNNAIERNAVI